MDDESEWNEDKAASNFLKHGVDFEEADSVLDDPQVLTFDDVDHSLEEERYIAIGFSSQNRLLYVVYTLRDGAKRIISARTATPRERKAYEHNYRN